MIEEIEKMIRYAFPAKGTMRTTEMKSVRLPVFAGIDPGATGAIAFTCADGTAFTADIPILKIKKKSSGRNRSEMNLVEIAQAILPFRKDLKVVRFALEEALVIRMGGGRPEFGNTAYTAFQCGCQFGAWLGLLSAFGLSYERVMPVVWKRSMGLLKQDKEASRLKALGMFPRADIRHKKDHGRAEAILLAEWLRRKCSGG